MECWEDREGWRTPGTQGLVSGPFLDVCTVWGPSIHSAICSDSGSLSTSISVSATMMKIKEGLGGAEKGSGEKGERKIERKGETERDIGRERQRKMTERHKERRIGREIERQTQR